MMRVIGGAVVTGNSVHAAAATDPLCPGIRLFVLDVDAAAAAGSGLAALLDDAERQDVARLAQPERRRRVGIARGALRAVLGASLGAPADGIPLVRDRLGRPSVVGVPDLTVSCSRSDGLAVFALARDATIGVDVEVVTADRFPDAIADVVLAARERRTWDGIAPADRSWWLARAWTAKEAIVKALGCGFDVPPTSVDGAPPAGALTRPAWRRAHGERPWWLYEAAWRGSVITVAAYGRPAPVDLVVAAPAT